jgi:excisionase family DNA binding protein
MADYNSETLLVALTIGDTRALLKSWIKESLSEIEKTSDQSALYYSRNEVCGLLKISLPTLSRYINLGLIKSHKVGNRIIISKEDINNALKDIK